MPRKSDRAKRLSQYLVGNEVDVRIDYVLGDKYVKGGPNQFINRLPGDPPDPPAVSRWIELRHPDLRESFTRALMRTEVVNGRLTCTGIHLETNAELTGADVRAFPIAAVTPLAATFAKAVNEELRDAPISEAKAMGRRGYEASHYEDVAKLYKQALLREPGKPIWWMTKQYAQDEKRKDPPSDDTVRRWVREVRNNRPELLEDPT